MQEPKSNPKLLKAFQGIIISLYIPLWLCWTKLLMRKYDRNGFNFKNINPLLADTEIVPPGNVKHLNAWDKIHQQKQK